MCQLFTIYKVGECVPNSTKEQGTEEVLKRQEWIMDTEKHWGQLEVDEKDYNAKVN